MTKPPAIYSTEGGPSRVDMKLISAMRLVLAFAALAVTIVEPSEFVRFKSLTYAGLAVYMIYSAALHLLSRVRGVNLPLRALHWIDLGWYLGLIALTSGTNSIFFFFLFFSILVASFWWGFAVGMSTAAVASVLFSVVASLSTIHDSQFQMNGFLLRSVYLLVLGYLIAYLGGHEGKLKQRLKFLKDINQLSNPRFGIGTTINWIMSRFCNFYKADRCLLIIQSEDPNRYSLKRVGRNHETVTTVRAIAEELSNTLLGPSPDQAVIYRRDSRSNLAYNVFNGETSQPTPSFEEVARAIDADCFLSVPLHYRCQPIGRLYLVGSQPKFDQSDIEFIIQAIEQVIPVLDNIRLVDELASDAAEQERQRIARDIHDGIVQPYIGLKLGLAAVTQKIERGDAGVVDDVRSLSDLVLRQITDLRSYIGGLEVTEPDGNVLLPALRRFASKFSQATGIQVRVSAPDNIRINDRLAAELFHMVTEGLSNVRRHTEAQCAEAIVNCENGHLILQIENENPNGPAKTSFHPKSLSARAEALGGELTVFADDDNRTIVNIQIP